MKTLRNHQSIEKILADLASQMMDGLPHHCVGVGEGCRAPQDAPHPHPILPRQTCPSWERTQSPAQSKCPAGSLLAD